MNRHRATRGFTLIELLVVIAVIAILLSVIVPVLKKAKEHTRDLVCKSNLRQIGIATRMYLDDSGGKGFKFSGGDSGNGFLWVDASGNYLDISVDYSYWGLMCLGYIESPQIFGCPSFRQVSELIYPVDPELIYHAAYGLNGHFVNLQVKDVVNPSTFIVASDHVEPKCEQGNQDMFHNNGFLTVNLTQYRAGGTREEFYRGIFRHHIRYSEPFRTGGRANILWLDGHVSSLEETTGDDVPERWYTGQ
jgi:prepilin-type N-terminal cleavage/methylation domain-containing protein/prepilin-type processing-associated H-X9-DG protein